MKMNAIKVAVVDDHTLFRKTLASFLSERNNIEVVIQAAEVQDLLRKLNGVYVDVLLMDIFMPHINGLEALKMIKTKYPAVKVLALSMCQDMELLSDLLDAGIYGIISKTDEPEELVRAIDSIYDQRLYRSRLFTEVMYWSKQHTIKYHNDYVNVALNEREKKILELLWEEKSNKEIASQLFLSVRSVEKIRQDMKEKIGVKSTVGLLKYAINKKVIGNHISV
ncbi:response regulator transcription factor [Paraflavitalea pollutisoli]|uniref:response regulator transcription factor n=1 Tax=Paraflavitalea pollutisoli TaxID=3034143 RepID=UPI0023ED11CE|nr:response regulator transcription factor [Paraflavitalea sp. H1-2-19X]